jgi:hypothetical protein
VRNREFRSQEPESRRQKTEIQNKNAKQKNLKFFLKREGNPEGEESVWTTRKEKTASKSR